MERQVILSFFTVFLVAIGLLSFKWVNSSPCDGAVFTTNTQTYKVGELINFRDNSPTAESWNWDFGDESETSTRQNPMHIYENPGEFAVTLEVNNKCVHTLTYTIIAKEKIIDSTKFPVFDLPRTILVGQTLTVEDKSQGAQEWEWRFGETSGVNATTPNAKYIYDKSGLKTVSLVINGDLEYITKKKISVLPAPEEQKESVFIPEKPTWQVKDKPKIPEAPTTTAPEVSDKPKIVPYINEDQLAKHIMDIARNGKKPEALAKYFCGDINKPVIANKKNSTFLILCEKIKDKKIKIKNLSIYRNEGSNCIKTITIDYKKGIF